MNQETQYAFEQLGRNSKNIADSLHSIDQTLKIVAMKELLLATEGNGWQSTYATLIHYRTETVKAERNMKGAKEEHGTESDEHLGERSFWLQVKQNLDKFEADHPVLVKFADLLEGITV